MQQRTTFHHFFVCNFFIESMRIRCACNKELVFIIFLFAISSLNIYENQVCMQQRTTFHHFLFAISSSNLWESGRRAKMGMGCGHEGPLIVSHWNSRMKISWCSRTYIYGCTQIQKWIWWWSTSIQVQPPLSLSSPLDWSLEKLFDQISNKF